MINTVSNTHRAPAKGLARGAFPLPHMSAFLVAPSSFAVGMASAMMRFWAQRMQAYAKPSETLAVRGVSRNLLANGQTSETNDLKENELSKRAAPKATPAKAVVMPAARTKRATSKPKTATKKRPTAKHKAGNAKPKATKTRRVSGLRRSGR